MKIFNTLLVALTFFISGVSNSQDVPKHLQIARDFVANTKPENNDYTTQKVYTRMPGDFLFMGNWVVDTDCSAFVADVLDRSISGFISNLPSRKFRTRVSVFDLLDSIEKEKQFKQIKTVPELRPGDILLWMKSKEDGAHLEPGHVLFVDSVAKKIKNRAPIVENSDQYEIRLIDVSQLAKSTDDPRYVSDKAERAANFAKGKMRGTGPSSSRRGIGTGSIRLYADKDGVLQGVAFNTPGSDVKETPDFVFSMARVK